MHGTIQGNRLVRAAEGNGFWGHITERQGFGSVRATLLRGIMRGRGGIIQGNSLVRVAEGNGFWGCIVEITGRSVCRMIQGDSLSRHKGATTLTLQGPILMYETPPP
jgi:hypothetical protein